MTNDIKGLGLPPSTDKAIRSTAKDGGSVAQAPAQPAPAPTGAGKAAAESVSLSSNAGSRATVLLFFPLAFTGVCTQELCDVTAGLSRYEGLNADVIAISVDSPFAQDAWAKKEKITLKLASDLNKEVIKAYDVVFPALAGIGDTAARSAFVIDKDGVIRYSEQTPSPKELPSFDKIEETLKSLS